MDQLRWAFCVAICASCGASGGHQEGGAAEPEKAIRGMTDAFDRGDVAAMRRVMVSPSRLKRAIECHGAESLVHDAEHAFQALDALAKVDKAKLRQIDIDDVRIDETKRETIARGDTFHGCTAREPFEARSYHVTSSGRIGPLADSEDEDEQVVRLDGVWWLLPAQ